jgi:bifunctional UDP-N-acetylglucosamine pyrophosphorylase/glucosamine-1-phosphate N-acetyltransferase
MNPDNSHRSLAVVILAAGKGTRMKSDLPKVAHRVLGRSVVEWVMFHARSLHADHSVVVVGHEADTVVSVLPPGTQTAEQHSQRGSGDAVAAALPSLEHHQGDVLVINGDGALFTSATLQAVVDAHQSHGAHASALAIRSDDDLPYGRVVSDDAGNLLRIVEAADASPDELAIRDLNAGVYCFDISALRNAVPQLEAHNAQGELYITDLLAIIRNSGGVTRSVVAGDASELLGINTRADLAEVERVLQQRINLGHMLAGVTLSQPDTILIEPDVRIEPDATILPGSMLRGATVVGARAVIGPRTTLVDTVVEDDAHIVESTCVEARVGAGASVGPYAYLRPETILSEQAKVGTFVELKKTLLGPRSKVPHLSYIGDATVGADSNIGAGNITANYRPELGRGKQPTSIGSNVRTGSDNVFVAPVSIGDGSFTGAGSIIVQDVPSGALAIARARQVNLQDYAQRLDKSDASRESSGDRHNRPDAADTVVRSAIVDPRD